MRPKGKPGRPGSARASMDESTLGDSERSTQESGNSVVMKKMKKRKASLREKHAAAMAAGSGGKVRRKGPGSKNDKSPRVAEEAEKSPSPVPESALSEKQRRLDNRNLIRALLPNDDEPDGPTYEQLARELLRNPAYAGAIRMQMEEARNAVTIRFVESAENPHTGEIITEGDVVFTRDEKDGLKYWAQVRKIRASSTYRQANLTWLAPLSTAASRSSFDPSTFIHAVFDRGLYDIDNLNFECQCPDLPAYRQRWSARSTAEARSCAALVRRREALFHELHREMQGPSEIIRAGDIRKIHLPAHTKVLRNLGLRAKVRQEEREQAEEERAERERNEQLLLEEEKEKEEEKEITAAITQADREERRKRREEERERERVKKEEEDDEREKGEEEEGEKTVDSGDEEKKEDVGEEKEEDIKEEEKMEIEEEESQAASRGSSPMSICNAGDDPEEAEHPIGSEQPEEEL